MDDYIVQIDDFTICLGEYGDDRPNALFWLQSLIQKVRGKIYIINFSKDDMQNFILECRKKWNEDNYISSDIFDKKVFVEQQIPCGMDNVYNYMESISKNDYVLIIGGEKLLPYNESKKVINTKYEGLTISANLMKDEKWDVLCLWLDKLYGDFQKKLQGIVVNIGIDKSSKDIILSLLDKSENMSIITSGYIGDDKESNYVISKFYEKITLCRYDEMIGFLDENRTKISNRSYVIMLSQLHTYFGLSTKAIKLLEENYDILTNESKKMLADLLYREGDKEGKAKKILTEIFKEDKFLNDLMPSILRVYDKDRDNIKERWIKIAREIDPDNPKVVEYYGNWLSHTKKYKDASSIFRKLKETLNNQYYEIIARINDILLSPPENPLDIQRYVLQSVQNYPKLHNEAILRLVTYFTDVDRSEYITYSLLNDINYDYNDELVYKLLNVKLDLLNDIVSATKALGKLRPHRKEEHAKKINIERIKCITNSITTLAKFSKGYIEWRRFIDDCQSQNGWSEVVYIELVKSIDELSSLNLEALISNSFIKKVESCSNDEKEYLGIKLLRRIKAGLFDDDNIYDAINGLLKYAEVENKEEVKIWGRYYASIIYSLRGDIQTANNYSLTILEYYNIVSEENKDVCILLGIMSWANSQYRIGREIEGIICVISCIKYISSVKEIYPILEEGLNIVGRFFVDNIGIVNDKDRDHIAIILKSLSKYNKSLILSESFVNDSLEQLENELKDTIYNYEEEDIEWAGHITNLIAIYIRKGEAAEAIELIRSKYKKIIGLYKVRVDLRCRLAENWARILFLNPSKGNYIIAKELLEVAISDIESKRNVYHKEERAVIGDMSRKIYKMYIEITTLMANTIDIKTISKNEYLKILEASLIKILPRSIIEQKKYNQEKVIDEILEEKENQLLKLKEEYNILYRKNSGGSDELNNLALEIEEIQEYLKLNHPHYKALPKIESINLLEIKKLLKNKEIFYQYIKLDLMIIQILIDREDIYIYHELFDSKEIEASIIKLNEYAYKNDVNKDDLSINRDIEILSKFFGRQVLDYCIANQVEKVYVMPDLSLGTYNLNMCQYNGISLIDKTKSIINILDYNILKNKKECLRCNKFVNRIFGNENDANLKLISNFLQNDIKGDHFIVENNTDEIKTLRKTIVDKNADTLILYGHGINDPNGSNFGGSLGIQGKREVIHIEDILKGISTIKNAILISCRGGVPLNDDIESSTGSWAELFETFEGNIIMCKWDVNTESSILMIKNILTHLKDYNLSLDESLIVAIKEVRSQYKNPIYWAGIELWLN